MTNEDIKKKAATWSMREPTQDEMAEYRAAHTKYWKEIGRQYWRALMFGEPMTGIKKETP